MNLTKVIEMKSAVIIAVFAFLTSQLMAEDVKELKFFGKSYEWVKRNASVLPSGCDFVYGGISRKNRLLYVGRVQDCKNIFPSAIHHYGNAGTETARYIGTNDTIKTATQVEWLCSKGYGVGWARVIDFKPLTLLTHKAIPIGVDREKLQLLYGCIVHSFFSDQYPPSIGIVRDGHCVFEVNGALKSSADFKFWHTLELLVAL